MAILPKPIYVFNTIPQNSHVILHRNRKNNNEIHMETQMTLDSQSNSEQKVQCWWYQNTQLPTTLQRHNNKIALYWHKNRQEDQWIRIEDPDINPHIYSQLVFDKGAQKTQWRKDILFNKCCWENWISACRRLKQDPCLSPCTKINSKWIKDLKTRLESLKKLHEAVGNTLQLIGIENDFLNRTQKAQHLRETMNKWD
jgi:hypothetical protein